MADHAGCRCSVVNPDTKLWLPPVEVTQFWRPRSGFAPVSVFEKPNKFISVKPNSNLNHFQQLLFHTIPPPLDQYNLFWSYKKRAPKPLLGRQNWVTSTGGRHNLVPGLTTEHRRDRPYTVWKKLNKASHKPIYSYFV